MDFEFSRAQRRAALLSTALCVVAIPTTALAQAVPTPNANQYGLGLIGAPAAWARGYNGAGVTVAVADSGIEVAHPAFAGKIDPRSMSFVVTLPGAAYDATLINDPSPTSHGTHVAGIIGSSAASGVPGDAYGTSLVVLRIFGNCNDKQNCGAPGIPSAGIAALTYFGNLNNVMLYNASYGPGVDKNLTVWPASIINDTEAEAAVAVLAKGKIIIAANGNDRDTNPIAGLNPNGLALAPFIQPANAGAGVYQDGGNNFNFSALQQQPGLIIAVNSVGADKTIAYYSQACGVTASWCVTAPGGDQQKDAGIYATLPVGTYGYMQGTSMATPMVTGALALLQGAYPTYVARDLANVLFATAENVGGRAADNATYGYGLIRLDRATDGPNTLASGAAVDVGSELMTYWSQPLTTAGGFTKTGAGYLMVAGKTAAAGDVAVNAGALGVDGTLTLQTQLVVAPGATLSGFGRIVGNTLINGTLSAGQLPNLADLKASNGGVLPAIPLIGTSPGTLTFQGNVTLAGSAAMRENIDGALVIPGGPGTFDKIIVTGNGATFTAGGKLVPQLRDIVGGNNNYAPAVGTAFQIVTAQNGATVTGQFANLAQPAAGLAPNTRLDVVYAATTVTLNVTPLNFQALAATQNLNPNAQALAGALDAVRPEAGARPGPRSVKVFNDLYDDTIAEDDSELAALSDQGQAANAGALLSAFSGFSDLLAGHQAENGLDTVIADAGSPVQVAWGYGNDIASDAGGGMGAEPAGWTAWAQVFGRWSAVGADAGLPGAHSNSGGFAFGADRRFADDLVAGTAFGFTRTATTSAGERADSETYAAALYASWTPGPFIVDARLAAGPTDSDTLRTVPLLGVPTLVNGTVVGFGVLGALEAGYRLDAGDVAIEPYLGVTAQNLHQSAFTETTAVGLSFPAQNFDKLVSTLGVRAATRFALGGFTISPTANVAWAHDLHDGGLVTHAAIFDTPFRIEAAEPGEDAALVGIDVSAWTSEAFSLFVGYSGEFRSNATSHEVNGGIRVAL